MSTKNLEDLLDEFDELQIIVIHEYAKAKAEQEPVAAAWLSACIDARDALKELGIYHRPVSNTWALRQEPPEDNIEFQTPVAAANALASQLAFLWAHQSPPPSPGA